MKLTLTFEINTKNNQQQIKKICEVLTRPEEFLFERSLNWPLCDASAKVSKGEASLTTMCQWCTFQVCLLSGIIILFLLIFLSHSRCILTSLKFPSDSL